MSSHHTKRDAVVCLYPITNSVAVYIHKNIGTDFEFIALSNLSFGSFRRFFQFLRNLNGRRLYFPAIDQGMDSILPILRGISLLSGALDWNIIRSNGRVEKCSPWIVFQDAWRVFLAVLKGLLSVSKIFWTLLKLQRGEKYPAPKSKEIKKLLYIRGNLWFGVRAGGAFSHVRGIVECFLRQGITVNLVSSSRMEGLDEHPNLTQTVVPVDTYILPREISHSNHAKNIVDMMMPSMGDYDAIYQRLSICGLSGLILARSKNIPLIIEYNGSEVWLARNWGMRLFFEKVVAMSEDACLRHADIVVAVSETLRNELLQRGIPANKIIVQPNGVDIDKFDSEKIPAAAIMKTRNQILHDRDGVLVTFVGTFGAWHGANVLATAIKELSEDDADWLEEHNVHFAFAGDGPNRNAAMEMLNQSNSSKYCEFVGLLDPDAVPQLLAACDILVAPQVKNTDGTEFFGSPTKLFEYMASGRAVIASNLGQVSKILSGCPRSIDLPDVSAGLPAGHVFGVLTEPGDSSELARAIRFLVNNPDWRNEMGRNARRIAIDEHSWEKRVASILFALDHELKRDDAKILQIRLLINAIHSKSGGGVTYLNNILPFLSSDPRLDIHLCIHGEQVRLFEQNLDGINLHVVQMSSSRLHQLFYEQIELPALARRIGAQVTFSPANYGPLFAPKTVLLLRNALSVALVEQRLAKLVYWGMLYIGTVLSLLVARRVISVSEYARKSSAGGILNVVHSRIEIIAHGISENFVPSEFGMRANNELLAVSDIYVQKNLHTLLQAFSLVLKEFPKTVLRIAGAPVDKEYADRLKALAVKLGISSSVKFEGSVGMPSLVKLYQHCTVFIFPSTIETFGNPLVEAMACGAPVACSNTAAMPEVAGDAVDYFNPNDINDIARVTCGLLANPVRRKKLSAQSTERAKMYSWEKTAVKTTEVLLAAARD